MKTIWQRLNSETPKFWKKAAWLGGVLTAVSVGIVSAPDSIEIPELIKAVAGYLATAGFVMTLLAKAATTDDQLSRK